MIEHIVAPYFRLGVEHTCKAPTEIFRRPEDNGIQCTGICTCHDSDFRYDILVTDSISVQEDMKRARETLIHVCLANIGAGDTEDFCGEYPWFARIRDAPALRCTPPLCPER